MKDEREDFNLDPEASWGKAEQLLDRHFRRKRWGLALLILLIAGVTTLVTVQLLDSQVAVQQQGKDALQPVAAETLPAGAPETDNKESPETQSVDGRLKQPAADPVTTIVPPSPSAMIAETRPGIALSKRSKSVGAIILSGVETNRSDVKPVISEQAADPTINSTAGGYSEMETESGVATAFWTPRGEPMALLPNHQRALYASGQPLLQERQIVNRQPKQEFSWHLTATTGAFQVFKNVESDWKSWDDIRNKREQEIVTGQVGVAVGVGRRSWDATIGVELTQYGERNEYVPRSYQDQYIDDSYWQAYTYWSVDTDTAYIMGNPWMMNTDVQMTDSNWVASYDTVNQLSYDPSIDAARTRTSIRYIEFPLDFTWRLSSNRWGFGITAGFAPAWLSSSRGRYISRSLRGSESMQELGELRQFLLNARFGLEAEYRMHPNVTLLVRPQYRQQFGSVFKEGSGISQRYQAAGVQAGVRYRFR